jgi:DNA-binding NtrC family response regulator
MASVLVVDDDPGILRYLKTLLEVEHWNVLTATNGLEALRALQQGASPDVVLLDLMMPGLDGLETLERARELFPRLKAIMLSCLNETPKVVQAMRLGAQDFLTKPVNEAELLEALACCLEEDEAQQSDLEADIEELGGDAFFLAASPAMHTIRNQVDVIAGVDVPVLLLGESGTGKEVLSLLIHKLSTRRHRKFLKVNCAAIPADLLESELFGYEPGAFTGATQAKPGKFELCDHGTILLDEIAEMPVTLQAKLLQVLQEQKFFRLGSRHPVSVDVRILAATNVNVEEAIKAGKLRLDLYYRLNAFQIHLPPLRERLEEIPALIQHYMKRLCGTYNRPAQPVTERLLQACARHPWPGNLRELHNFVKRYVILGDEAAMVSELSRSDSGTANLELLAHLQHGNGKDLKTLIRDIKGEAEAEAIRRALQQTNWNRKKAAALLNISYKALVYKARQYGLEPLKARAAAASGSNGSASRHTDTSRE